MICPVCGERLREIQRSGIEIDVCPGCKGIWLDRGELEKLIALEGRAAPRAMSDDADARVTSAPRAPEYRSSDEHDEHRHHADKHDRGHDEHDSRGTVQHGTRRRNTWQGDILGGIGGGGDD